MIGHRKPGRGGDREFPVDGKEQGDAVGFEHRPDCGDDCLKKLFDRTVFHHEFGQGEEAASLLLSLFGFGSGRLQPGCHLGDQEHDHDIDPEDDPVLARADGESVVGGDEEVVVDQEPGDHGDDTGGVAARDDCDYDRHDQDQTRSGDAEMGTQREHRGPKSDRCDDPD